MAKKQRSFLLPTDILDWLKNEELDTGIPQTRILVAATIHFALSNWAERNQAVTTAVQVEKGDLQVLDVLESHLNTLISGYEFELEGHSKAKKGAGVKELTSVEEARLKELRWELERLKWRREARSRRGKHGSDVGKKG